MAEKKSVIVDYTQGNLFRQLIVFAVPFILSALLQNLYSLVDTMVVGQVVGSGGLSGVSTSGQITGLMTNMVMGFSTAGQVMISQYVGAKKPENLRRTVGTAFTITTLFALVLMVVCIGFSNTILRWMNTPAEAFRQARQYLIICSFGFVFVCGYNTACAILRGSGDSKRPFAIIAATSIANLVLDLVFVVGFKMESAGAALATVISQAISMALSMRIFYRHREDFGFTFRLSSFRMDPHELKLLVRQGVPLALKSGSISLSLYFMKSDASLALNAPQSKTLLWRSNSLAMAFLMAMNADSSSPVFADLSVRKITGCLRISRESIFTGLNNLSIVSILSPDYGEYFGFTDDEVKEMLGYYGLPDKYGEVQSWYNGYIFGNSNVYNPWSVIMYLRDHIGADRDYFPVSYWANTSSNSIVRDLVERADSATKAEIERLIKWESIEKPIHEDITYGEIYKKQDNLWNFLLFTGYLKAVSRRMEGDKTYAALVIPNRETRYIYSEKILNWFDEEIVKKSDRGALFGALKEGDAQGLEREINRLLAPSISYMDSYENFYHGFMAGILSGNRDYMVKSNRESGDGRSDLLVKPVRIFEKAFVIELKAVKQRGKAPVTMEMMDAAAEEAIKQIDDRRYADALLEDGYGNIGRYGISFFRKDCRVHYKEGY